MNKEIKKQMTEWGRLGGLKTMEKYGKKHFISASKKAVKARKTKAKHVYPHPPLV